MENSKANLAKAIIAVMAKVKGIDKTLTVGSGSSAYKGVSDQEVKKIIGDAMVAHGLCIIPIGVEAKAQVDRWEEVDQYSKSTPKDMKTKQSVFTEATTKYLLLHESGESIEVHGYGHGIDSQDKGAGKATTYALKYALLYIFMVPTGKIDDADATHSDVYEAPKKQKPVLNPKSEKWTGAIAAIASGKTTIEKVEAAYSLTGIDRELLLSSALETA